MANVRSNGKMASQEMCFPPRLDSKFHRCLAQQPELPESQCRQLADPFGGTPTADLRHIGDHCYQEVLPLEVPICETQSANCCCSMHCNVWKWRQITGRSLLPSVAKIRLGFAPRRTPGSSTDCLMTPAEGNIR